METGQANIGPIQLPVNSNWPSLLSRNVADVANPSLKWRIGSRFVVPTVGLFSKFWMNLANHSTVYNSDVLYEALNRNYQAVVSRGNAYASEIKSGLKTTRRPLITYSNHTSCLDDPFIWGALIPFRWQFNSDRHRWSGAAAEICFARKWHSIFFSLGKTFPIIRGGGIYQPAMDYASKLLKCGQWIHFFPEGKVVPRLEHSDPNLLLFSYDENGKPVKSSTDSNSLLSSSLASTIEYTLKWGMARLIIEHVLGEGENIDKEYNEIVKDSNMAIMSNGNSSSVIKPNSNIEHCIQLEDDQVLPEVDVLPIYHIGMDEVLPTRRPYIPRIFRKVTFLVRPEGPIRIDKKFLTSLFSDDHKGNTIEMHRSQSKNSSSNSTQMLCVKQSQPHELSLTEKRIRLMQYLEAELNRLGEKARLIHERFN